MPIIPIPADEIDAKLAEWMRMGIDVQDKTPRPITGSSLIKSKKKTGPPKMPVALIEAGYERGEGHILFTIPLKLDVVSNGGAYKKWMKSQATKHRTAVSRAFAPRLRDLAVYADLALKGAPVVCTVTRLSPGHMDKHDGLPATCKWVVDAVASFLGVDDGRGPVDWKYAQETRAYYGTKVRLEAGVVPSSLVSGL